MVSRGDNQNKAAELKGLAEALHKRKRAFYTKKAGLVQQVKALGVSWRSSHLVHHVAFCINLIEGKDLARTFGDSSVEYDGSSQYSIV